MTTKEFIEAAIEGGWKKGENVKLDPKYGLIISWTAKKDHDNGIGHGMTLLDWTELYLDPEAWKSVGKVKGWSESYDMTGPIYLKLGQKWENNTNTDQDPEYYQKMYLMIGFLLAGKTLEEYIATL